jgi:hypothetical protein
VVRTQGFGENWFIRRKPERNQKMLTAMILAALTGYTSVPPVNVASCQIETPIIVPQGNDGDSETIGGYSVRVRFSDAAAQPISKVVFRLNDGNTVSDVGTFSPGVSIDHKLALNDQNATACTADSAVLADGTRVSVSTP